MAWWRFWKSEQRADFDQWKNPPILGFFGPTASGVTVTNENPITHDTVFSCINVIAEGCAMLPLYLYRVQNNGRIPATDHPLYDLMLNSPCPHMSAFAYWKLVLFEKIHYGNHYSLVIRGADGRVRELYPIENGRVQPFWYTDPVSGLPRRAYRVSAPASGQQAVFLEDEIFHVQNLPPLRGPNYALLGASVWSLYQAETIGGALAINQSASSNLANGGSLSGMIAYDAPLSADQAKDAKAMIREEYAGAPNSGKIGVFGGGAKYTQMSQTNEQAQLLETRKYNRSVIAGILRVTAHLINDLERGTFSNVEHLDLAHYKHCLNPHLRDLRQTARKDLLTPEERGLYELDHDPTEMLRGDQKTFAEVLEKAIQNARMTPNEARALTNLAPLPGGDALFINSASVPLDQAGQSAQPKETSNV